MATKKKAKKPSSKTVRALRKRTIAESEALGEEIHGLGDDLLKSIIRDGPPSMEDASVTGDRKRFFVPEDIPPLKEGDCYHIKNEFGEGVFILSEIVSGRTTFFIFKGYSTGIKTTYTPASIRDLVEKTNYIKPLSPAEAERIDREMPRD